MTTAQASVPGIAVGVDIGGTFTDVVVADRQSGGVLAALKVLTTPDDPLRGFLDGVARALGECGGEYGRIRRFVHGTTLATNAVIERKGARTALLTTDGFRDVLETGRELRYDLYSLDLDYPAPLVPRRDRIAVRERLDAAGAVREPVCRASVARIGADLAESGIESIAICFMHSYVDGRHESEVADLIATAMPGIPVTCSHRLLPQIGEFTRASTTVVNAYVRPLMADYLSRMREALVGRGFAGEVDIIASNGGTVDLASAIEAPAALIESGPAAGITAAVQAAIRIGERSVVAFDMGGTTAKLCLVQDHQPRWTAELEVARAARFERGSGIPIALPSVDLIEIGAGGGSLARIDRAGSLQVGPDSAGSRPGPACYGLGGTQPTVTDANLVLGYLDPGYFSGGAMRLDLDGARSAIGGLAGQMGCSTEQAAASIFDLVTETMSNAARVHVAEAGYDVRKAALLAFGGGGPVHAWRMAQLLGGIDILVPTLPGVLSAFGCIVAPTRFDMMRTFVSDLDHLDRDRLSVIASGLAEAGRRKLATAGIARKDQRLSWSLDMKYLGQRYQINVPIAAVPSGPADIHALRLLFGTRYRETYGREIAGQPVEIITVRLVASGPAASHPSPGPTIPSAGGPARQRPVSFGRGYIDTPVMSRADIGPDARFQGPLVIEDTGSTIVVPPGAAGTVYPDGAIRLTMVRAGTNRDASR